MLKIRIIIIFILLGQFLNAQTFDISVDTMIVDIKEIVKPASRIDMTHVVKFEDKYYCFFSEQGLYAFRNESRYFLILSDKGEVLNNITLPEKIENTIYFDFFIRKGNLFAKTYMDHDCFKFDMNKLEWISIKEVDDSVYEDSDFAITYLNFGEWGQSTWFIDQQTKKEYVLGAYGTTINKLNGNYYLTGSTVVRVIEHPKQLKACDNNYYYEAVEKEPVSHEGSESLLGSYTIYNDTLYSPWDFEDPKKYIITSFVANNKLFQLYSDSSQTYIGKIENNQLIPIQTLGKKYETFNWNYSYRGKNLDNNSRFIKFREEKNTYGFLEINNNKIDIEYLIHNQDSLNYLGKDGFSELLDLIINKKNNITQEQIDRLEKSIKGVDMKDYRSSISHNGYYPEIYSKQDVKTKGYVKVQNKYIAQETEYLRTAQDNLVKSIFIGWIETEPYQSSHSFNLFNDNNPKVREQFMLKMKEIERMITGKTNLKPEKKDSENGYVDLIWNFKNGIVIKLYGSEDFEGAKEIRMIINLE